MGVSILGLESSCDWMELSFRNYTWKVNLEWDCGMLSFDGSWQTFINEAKLFEGDICVFQQTKQVQKIRVAVFEGRNVEKIKMAGMSDHVEE